MKKTIWVLIIIVIAVIAIVWATGSGTDEAPVEEGNGESATSTATSTPGVTSTDESVENLGDDATSSINNQLEGIDVEGVEDEFNDLDQDMNDL